MNSSHIKRNFTASTNCIWEFLKKIISDYKCLTYLKMVQAISDCNCLIYLKMEQAISDCNCLTYLKMEHAISE